MKRIIIGLFMFVVCLIGFKEKENIIIPDSAIRFRVIANSNDSNDQILKLSVKNEVEKELYKLLEPAKNIEDARKIIKNNLETVDNILKKYNVNYEISYGNNYFPVKKYKGISYDAGNYESLVIKIGEGLGKNWWCVLFPPLCLLDNQDNLDDVNYELYASKIINKFK